ncbi:hypothetical protein QUA81_00005 [Microcoleus sp. F6_B4]
MSIKIIGDGAIAVSGMRRGIVGWECECDRIFCRERSIASRGDKGAENQLE